MNTRTISTEEKFVKDNKGLVYKYLHNSGYWSRFPNHREDMVQEGLMALVKAYRNFRPKYGVKVSTYAYILIRNAVYDYAQKMKLNRESFEYPLDEQLVEGEQPLNTDAIIVMKLMEEEEKYKDLLYDYLVQGYSQQKVAEKYGYKQQWVSHVVNRFRGRVRDEFYEEED